MSWERVRAERARVGAYLVLVPGSSSRESSSQPLKPLTVVDQEFEEGSFRKKEMTFWSGRNLRMPICLAVWGEMRDWFWRRRSM